MDSAYRRISGMPSLYDNAARSGRTSAAWRRTHGWRAAGTAVWPRTAVPYQKVAVHARPGQQRNAALRLVQHSEDDNLSLLCLRPVLQLLPLAHENLPRLHALFLFVCGYLAKLAACMACVAIPGASVSYLIAGCAFFGITYWLTACAHPSWPFGWFALSFLLTGVQATPSRCA